MSRRPVTLPPEATVAYALRLFLKHRVSCTGPGFEAVGIVSWRDVLKALI
ncbi:MAG: hypothetical protein NVS9B2_21120 [Steroidobacteraceae bacterium]